MSFLTIAVTDDDIAQGVPCSETHCPLAIAIRRAKPELGEVNVESDGWDRGLNTWAPLTTKAKTWVLDFDLGLPVRPARFRLQMPTYRMPA